MQIIADSPEQYINIVGDKQRGAIEKMRQTVLNNLPLGFEEVMSYGMITYVVPLKLYHKGYRGNPKQPLPFISIAAQKHHLAFYHFGIYADSNLYNWFVTRYNTLNLPKMDMGKGCIRFKNADIIPFELLGDLVKRISCDDWIRIYEESKA